MGTLVIALDESALTDEQATLLRELAGDRTIVITKDKATIYRVDDDIPIMLIDKGIPAAQIKDL